MKAARVLATIWFLAAVACGEDGGAPSAQGRNAGAAGTGATGSAGRAGGGAGTTSGNGATAGAGRGGSGGGAGMSGSAGGSAGTSGASGSNAGGTSASGAGGSNAGGAGGGAAAGNAGAAGASGTAGTAASGGSAPATCPDPAGPTGSGVWRSKLYPKDWKPVHAGGQRNAQGQALPDFSYAGYRLGAVAPPVGQRPVVATVPSDLGDGKKDATTGIQQAIDAACAKGGGAVLVPAGTYRVTMPAGKTTALEIGGTCSNVTLRGVGPKDSRILFDDPTDVRAKSVLRVGSSTSIWDTETTPTKALAKDALETTRKLTLKDVDGLAAGQLIAVRNVNTPAFRADHRMDEATSKLPDLWPASSFLGLFYPRRIVAIDGNEITVDVPTQYALKTRDAARVYALPASIEEVGVEGLSIGMVASKAKETGSSEADSDQDYEVDGTLGYAVHASQLVNFSNVHDSWMHDVETFVPTGNPAGIGLLSVGINIGRGAFRVTFDQVDIGQPQYRGGGGNGYAFQIAGHDNLIIRSSTYGARHGITTAYPVSGNVFSRMKLRKGRLSTDTHRFLAHANLFEQMELESTWLQSVNRGITSGGAGHTGTRIVFWNTKVLEDHPAAKGCAIESAQLADGYLIGSQKIGTGTGVGLKLCPDSFTNASWAKADGGAPVDFVEGEGKSALLDPPSLFEAQRIDRANRDGLPCPPTP